MTYRQLLGAIDAAAADLMSVGVKRGSYVTTVLGNSVEHAVVILAIARLGAVAALMSPRLEPRTIAHLLGRDRIEYAVVPSDSALVEAASAVLPPARLIVLDDRTDAASIGLSGAGDPGELPPHGSFTPDDPAYVLYTSGTTGLPKGVVLPQRTTVPRLVIMATQGNLRFGSHNRVPGILPLHHAMGLHATLLVTLAFNGTYYVIPHWEPQKVLSLIARERLTFLLASPTHLYDLLALPECSPAQLESLEAVGHTGAPMPPSVLERLVRVVDVPIGQLYGSTEMMNSLYADHQRDSPQVMRPGFFASVRVVKVGGRPDELVARGETGELIVAMNAPGVFAGYLGQPEATREKVRDGWFRTGDAVCELLDGRLELKGRCDDVILSGAENIHPQEVEQVLLGHPRVREAAVVGVAHPRWGQVVVACVEAAGAAPSPESLDRHCRESELPNFKRPRHYLFVDALPRNAMQKVMRNEVLALATERLGDVDTVQLSNAQ